MANTRWKEVKLEPARTPLWAQVATDRDRTPTVLPAHIKVKYLPAGRALNSHTFIQKGGMQGCVTGGNGLGAVPMAFNTYKHGAE